MNRADRESIHKFCTRNRDLLARSSRAGCFYCEVIFDPSEIKDWIDGRQVESGRLENGVTALCPRCGIDAVLPGAAPIVLDGALLADMRHHFYRSKRDLQQTKQVHSDRSQSRRFTEESGEKRLDIAAALEGQTCHALLVQAFWVGGELVDTANAVFVQTTPTTWVRFYIDAGDLGWTIDPELRSIASYQTDSGSMRYPITDVGAEWGLVGEKIECVTFEERQPAPAGVLILTFSDGRCAALINEADHSRLELLTATA